MGRGRGGLVKRSLKPILDFVSLSIYKENKRRILKKCLRQIEFDIIIIIFNKERISWCIPQRI